VSGAPGADIRRVGVIGCGLMGAGIAEVCARAGLDVVVHEVSPGAADAGRVRITASLDRGVRRGKLTGKERDAALARVRVTPDLTELADRDLLVEAATEDEKTHRSPQVRPGIPDRPSTGDPRRPLATTH
jgi:3-hydroxybutyryl-CoA dehydrogenase